ncbi:hypothetical protein ZHAS_00011562 [Anopheles sinensis]|uniref:Uncharacterized protein n=1 Tax=Anopheles sinensis TaxID=74873 RepID=A0A084W077_ANOSI|nr:hypothetical protein ZHAS_00011562 [Anopheles sinensis]
MRNGQRLTRHATRLWSEGNSTVSFQAFNRKTGPPFAGTKKPLRCHMGTEIDGSSDNRQPDWLLGTERVRWFEAGQSDAMERARIGGSCRRYLLTTFPGTRLVNMRTGIFFLSILQKTPVRRA